MRKLMWFTVGFSVACAAAIYVYMGLWALLLSALTLGTCVGLFSLKTVKSKMTALVLLGAAAGFLWVWGYDELYLNTARSLDGRAVSCSVTVTDYSYSAKNGIAAEGYVHLEGKRYRICVYSEVLESLQPGDRLTGNAVLRLTSGDGETDPTYHRGNGILLLGYMEDTAVVEQLDAPLWVRLPAQLRQRIITVIDAVFPGDVSGFARALLIGDTTALQYEQDVQMQLTGIRHVVAVSGLHVSILFSFAYTVGGKRGIWTALLGIPLLVLFAAVAGFTPSVLRACIMQILMTLSLLLNKEYDPPTALAAAVLGILLWDPMLITSASLQLSAGCIIGIFLFQQPVHDWLLRGKMKKLAKGKGILARMLRFVVSTVSVSISATVTTAPLVAFYFGTVSIVGVLTNLLTLWVISFVFYGIILTCVLCSFSVTAATVVAWIVAWPVRYVLAVVKVLAGFPLAAVYTCSIYIVLWLIMCYVLLAAFLKSRKKHPVIYSACVAVGLALAILAGWLEPVVTPVYTTVLDVGQGQCILLFSEAGVYMVDCGGNYGKTVANSAAQLLLSRGVTHLDGLILTHYDADHANGAEYFLSRFPVERLYLPDTDEENTIRRNLQQKCPSGITWVEDELQVTDGASQLRLYPGPDSKNTNESCMSVLFQKENYDILITGDLSVAGENVLLDRYRIPELDVLIVGHHGADTSTGNRLLKQTMPREAVLSVGEDNSYGHPSQIIIDRLKLYGCRIWRTDQDGTIDFRG